MSDGRNDFSVRECTENDADLLYTLEKECFPEDPWTKEMFSESLENLNCRVFVMLCGDSPVAYGVLYWIMDECDIANIAVLPGYRGRGHGYSMLGYMLEKCSIYGVERVFLDVRESNTPARELYKKYGFTEIGRRKGYYSSPREDAIEMMKVLSDDNTCS